MVNTIVKLINQLSAVFGSGSDPGVSRGACLAPVARKWIPRQAWLCTTRLLDADRGFDLLLAAAMG